MNEPETRLQFFAANSAENVSSKLFCQVTITDPLLKSLECSEGHKLTRGIIQCVARALFQVFKKIKSQKSTVFNMVIVEKGLQTTMQEPIPDFRPITKDRNFKVR